MSENDMSAFTGVGALPPGIRERLNAGADPASVAQECWGMYGPKAVEYFLTLYERDRRGGLPAPSMGFSYVDETATLGEHTKVWHYARVLAHAKIGNHCSIGGGTEIGRGSIIGDYSRIGANCFFPPNSRIGQRVFVGPGVNAADDRHPFVHGMDDPAYTAEPPVIEDEATIGIHVVLLPGVRIGHGAIVAAGSVVTKDVPPFGTVRGEPARPFAMSDTARSKFRRSA